VTWDLIFDKEPSYFGVNTDATVMRGSPRIVLTNTVLMLMLILINDNIVNSIYHVIICALGQFY
jgi:hypothetical protein